MQYTHMSNIGMYYDLTGKCQNCAKDEQTEHKVGEKNTLGVFLLKSIAN